MNFVGNTAMRSEKYLLVLFVLGLLSLSANCWSLSLFNEEYYRPLIADRKAFLPGDVLTVLVMENANAQSAADLSSKKKIKSALEAGYNKDQLSVDFDLHGEGNAQAKTARNGKIKASLTVRLKEVLNNNSYLVEGMQLITINGEQQRILLSGIVRPEDISAQNTVLSTRLGDAHITYAGTGSVSNAQDRNYLYKILSYVGLV